MIKSNDCNEPTAYQRGQQSSVTNGKRLLLPSELKKGVRRRAKDWGECLLTFDKIREPVRAGDGNIYERWAITKWLAENNNRSPLTNMVIDPNLEVLTDDDEGVGARHVLDSPQASLSQPPAHEIDAAPGKLRGGDVGGSSGRKAPPDVVCMFDGGDLRRLQDERAAREEEAKREEEERHAKLAQRGFQPYTGYAPLPRNDTCPSPGDDDVSSDCSFPPTQLSGLVPPSQLPHHFSPACSVVLGSAIHPENLHAHAPPAPANIARGPAAKQAVAPALQAVTAPPPPAAGGSGGKESILRAAGGVSKALREQGAALGQLNPPVVTSRAADVAGVQSATSLRGGGRIDGQRNEGARRVHASAAQAGQEGQPGVTAAVTADDLLGGLPANLNFPSDSESSPARPNVSPPLLQVGSRPVLPVRPLADGPGTSTAAQAGNGQARGLPAWPVVQAHNLNTAPPPSSSGAPQKGRIPGPATASGKQLEPVHAAILDRGPSPGYASGHDHPGCCDSNLKRDVGVPGQGVPVARGGPEGNFKLKARGHAPEARHGVMPLARAGAPGAGDGFGQLEATPGFGAYASVENKARAARSPGMITVVRGWLDDVTSQWGPGASADSGHDHGASHAPAAAPDLRKLPGNGPFEKQKQAQHGQKAVDNLKSDMQRSPGPVTMIRDWLMPADSEPEPRLDACRFAPPPKQPGPITVIRNWVAPQPEAAAGPGPHKQDPARNNQRDRHWPDPGPGPSGISADSRNGQVPAQTGPGPMTMIKGWVAPMLEGPSCSGGSESGAKSVRGGQYSWTADSHWHGWQPSTEMLGGGPQRLAEARGCMPVDKAGLHV